MLGRQHLAPRRLASASGLGSAGNPSWHTPRADAAVGAGGWCFPVLATSSPLLVRSIAATVPDPLRASTWPCRATRLPPVTGLNEH